MAKKTEVAASVDDNALQAGFKGAMERIREMKIDKKSTLIDNLSDSLWADWDATEENPTLIDSDGIDGADFSSDDETRFAA